MKLAAYLVKPGPGERAELVDMRGFGTGDLRAEFRDIEIQAREGTNADKPFFHVQLRSANGEGKKLSYADWAEIANRCDKALGPAWSHQPRAASFHIDRQTGDRHLHLAYSRLRMSEDGQLHTINPGMFKNKLKRFAREIERDFGLKIVSNERAADDRAKSASRNELEESRRLGTDLKTIRAVILECFEKSDSGKAFNTAIRAHGGILAAGDRRDCFVVIDPAGGQHALNKKLTGMTLAQIRDRLSDLDHSQLPSVDQAKDIQAGNQVQREKRQRPPHGRDHDRDGDGPPKSPTPSHGPENGASVDVKPPRDLGKTAGEIRLAWRLTDTGPQFAQEIEKRGLILVHVSRDEADASHRAHAFAKAINRQRRELREGFAVVDRRGNVTRIDQRVTGDLWDEIGKRLGGIGTGTVMTVAHARAVMKEANRADFAELKQGERFERQILDAEKSAGGDRQKFAAELKEAGFRLARVTASDVKGLDDLRQDQQFAAAADAGEKGQQFGRVKEGELAAVTKSGDVYRLNPRNMAALDSSSIMAGDTPLPSVLELRKSFEIERQLAADFRQTMVDIQLQRRDDAAVERLTAFQERAASQEVRHVVGKVERAAELPFSGGGKVIEQTLDFASDALGALIKPVEGAVSFLGNAFSAPAAPSAEQAERAYKAAIENYIQSLDQAAYQQNEARRSEQIERRDEEQSQHLTAPHYFRPITRPVEHGPNRDDDYGRERERERER